MNEAFLQAVMMGAALMLVSGNVTAETPKRGGILSFAVVTEPPTSASRATKHPELWKEVEGLFKAGSIPPNIKRRSLGQGESRLTLG